MSAQPPKPKRPTRTFVPRRIVGELWGAWVDENGETVGEEQIGPVTLWRPDFPRVDEIVEQKWPEVLEAIKGREG